jgi:hypothetical protein
MKRAALALALLIAAPLSAQMQTPVEGVSIAESLHATIMALPDSAYRAYCITHYRRDPGQRIYIDDMRPAARAMNPDCDPRDAILLVRPYCAFSLEELHWLPVRVLYVVAMCRPNAYGMSMRRPSLERST